MKSFLQKSKIGKTNLEVTQIDKMYGFNPHLSPIKSLYDQGKVAVINGIGYDNPNRSHFRSILVHIHLQRFQFKISN